MKVFSKIMLLVGLFLLIGEVDNLTLFIITKIVSLVLIIISSKYITKEFNDEI